MALYRRPALPQTEYRDDAGALIAYGRRWDAAGPPDEAYSRTSNLERFAPIHDVADALIAWLRADFDTDVEDDASVAADLLHDPGEVARAIRVSPRARDAAALTFVFTPFPGVLLHAGALQDCLFPVCGCDACDDDVVELSDELEWTVRTVTTGGFSERITRSSVHHAFSEPGVGSRSGECRVQDLPATRIAAAREMIPADGRWKAWPARP